MNLLQILLILGAIILSIVGISIIRKKTNFLYMILIWFITLAVLIFVIFPNILNGLWHIFGVQRWSIVLVYTSIIILFYFWLFLFNKLEQNSSDLTNVIRNFALQNVKKNIKNNSDTIFVIPAYDEWPVLKKTLDNLLNNWYKNIILVNDWSTDNTDEVLEEYKGKIIIINHIKNRWQGAALETGFEYIRRFLKNNQKLKYVVTYDSDWQHNIKDLPNFLNAFKENDNLEVVLWSRFLKQSKTNIPFLRKVILLLWKLFTFIISWKYFSDVHNWYRVIKKEALSKIRITNDGMAHASEIQDIIADKKMNFKEIPVNIEYTDYSIAKWQKSSNAIKIATRMIWFKLFK